MGLGRGGTKGQEGDDSGQMVVGTGVTMDYSVVDDGNLTVSQYVLRRRFFFCSRTWYKWVSKERQKCTFFLYQYDPFFSLFFSIRLV